MPVENSYTPQNFIVSFKKKKIKVFKVATFTLQNFGLILIYFKHIPATEKKIPWILTREIQ